jgi:hypothetical protein
MLDEAITPATSSTVKNWRAAPWAGVELDADAAFSSSS